MAPDKEFDAWVETAASSELHKFFIASGNYSRSVEDAERRAHLLGRSQEAINQFFRLNPIKEFKDRRPSTPHEDEGREAG